jgi:hypothetical protein
MSRYLRCLTELRRRRPSGNHYSLIPSQYSFADPVWNKNRSLRGGYAYVEGQPEYHPEGLYYLRFLCGSKRI